MVKKSSWVGMNIDADIAEGVYASVFMKEFFTKMKSSAHLHTVNVATHSRMSHEFDVHMSRVAETNKKNFFHVYEFSPTGEPYQRVGKNSKKLWKHTRSGRGTSMTFSWTWKAAQNYNPTYTQRRGSAVGKDGIRSISNDEFQKLIDKSSGRRHKFIWKAPLLETGTELRVYSRSSESKLFLPFNDGRIVYSHYVMSSRMAPGDTEGHFSRQWTRFWNVEAQEKWSKIMGQEIEADAARRVQAAMSSGRKPVRARQKKFGSAVAADTRKANIAGKEQAQRMIEEHRDFIRRKEKEKKEFDDFG